jgi:hypothetical protein
MKAAVTRVGAVDVDFDVELDDAVLSAVNPIELDVVVGDRIASFIDGMYDELLVLLAQSPEAAPGIGCFEPSAIAAFGIGPRCGLLKGGNDEICSSAGGLLRILAWFNPSGLAGSSTR